MDIKRTTAMILKKIPGGVKTVEDLYFQLKKPLFHRNQRHAEPDVVTFVGDGTRI